MRIPKVSRRLQPQRRADRRARLPVGAGAVLALAVGWEWSLKTPLRETLGRGGGSPVCTDDDVEYVLVTKRGFALFSFFTDTCFSLPLSQLSLCVLSFRLFGTLLMIVGLFVAMETANGRSLLLLGWSGG